MESILNENIKALKERNPDLVEEIIRYPKNGKIRVYTSKTGLPTISLENEAGRKVFIHSLYDPQREADRFVRAQRLKKGDTVILFGLGLGYHIPYILSIIGEDGLLLGIEMNPFIFRVALETVEMAYLLRRPNFELIISDNPFYIKEIITNRLITRDLNQTKLVIHSPSLEILPDSVRGIEEFLKNIIFTRRSIQYFSDLLDENILENIDYILKSPGIKGLFGRFSNLPIVIVSAGPSLDESIEDLRKFQKKGLVITSGKSLKPLIEGGIIPDLIVITDPQRETYKQMEGFLDLRIPLIFIPSICSQILKEYRGPKIVALMEQEFLHPDLNDLREDKGEVNGGGSVATVCLDIAIRLDGDPIIFVGQDLCFPQDKIYSSGIHAMEDWLNSMNKFNTLEMVYREFISKGEDLYVEGVTGGMVRTKRNLLSYLRWMEWRIRREPQRTFINTSRFGARIAGTKEIPLSEFIKNLSFQRLDRISLDPPDLESERLERWKRAIFEICQRWR